MMKEPTRSVKAVLLPSEMVPKAEQRIAVRGGGGLVMDGLSEGRGGEGCVFYQRVRSRGPGS